MTLSTFATRLLAAASFLVPVPVLVPDLDVAAWVAAGWGLVLLTALNWVIARAKGSTVYLVIGEHLAIAAGVIVAAQFVGQWAAATFA